MKLFNLSAIGIAATLTLGACTDLNKGAASFNADYNAAFNYMIAIGLHVKSAEEVLVEYRDDHGLHKALWIANDGAAFSSSKGTVQSADANAKQTCLENTKATCYRVMLDDKFAGK